MSIKNLKLFKVTSICLVITFISTMITPVPVQAGFSSVNARDAITSRSSMSSSEISSSAMGKLKEIHGAVADDNGRLFEKDYSAADSSLVNTEDSPYWKDYKKIPVALGKIFPKCKISAPMISLATTDDQDGERDRIGRLDLVDRDGAKILEVPAPLAKDAEKMGYEYMFLPVTITKDNMPNDLVEIIRMLRVKSGEYATKAVQDYLDNKFTNEGIHVFNFKDAARSDALPADMGDVAVDLSRTIAVPTDQGDLMIIANFWVKRDPIAMRALGERIKNQGGKVPKNKKSKAYLGFSPGKAEDIDSNRALELMSEFVWSFLDDFSKEDYSKVPSLIALIQKLDLETILNPASHEIEINKRLSIFRSAIDKLNGRPSLKQYLEDNPGQSYEDYIKKWDVGHLGRFMDEVTAVKILIHRLYLLVARDFKKDAENPELVPDLDLQNTVLAFYYKLYHYLIHLGYEKFGDTAVFEPLRQEVKSFYNKLNSAIIAGAEGKTYEFMDKFTKPVNEIVHFLGYLDINLSDDELKNLQDIHGRWQDYERRPFSLLVLAEIFELDNFLKFTRHFKLSDKNIPDPDKIPKLVIDGSGQVARQEVFEMMTDNYNERHSDKFRGQYAVRTTSIDPDDPFKSALGKAIGFFDHPVVRDSGVKLVIEGRSHLLADLYEAGRLTLKVRDKVLAAHQDFIVNDDVNCVYAVDLYLKENLNAITTFYFIDVAEFKKEMKKLRPEQVNIPRPMIVIENGEIIFFNLMLEATPGGIHVGTGDADVDKSLKSPTLWETLAINPLRKIFRKMSAEDETGGLELLLSEEVKYRTGGRPYYVIKAQITKAMIYPDILGAGINLIARFVFKLPKMVEKAVRFITPGSCSTNCKVHINYVLSLIAGGANPGQQISDVGGTWHMYTTSDTSNIEKAIALLGHLAAKTTGAAKGVFEQLRIWAQYTALRTPVPVKDGVSQVAGGSQFYSLTYLPEDISEDFLKWFLARFSREFPEILQTVSEDEKDENGKYTWKKHLAGTRTGAIVFLEHFTQVTKRIWANIVGYDNEVSFGSREHALIKEIALAIATQKALRDRESLIPSLPEQSKRKYKQEYKLAASSLSKLVQASSAMAAMEEEALEAASSAFKIRTVDDLPKNLPGAFIAGNLDLPKSGDTTKFDDSVPTILAAFKKVGLRGHNVKGENVMTKEIFLASHYKRPSADDWKRDWREYSLIENVVDPIVKPRLAEEDIVVVGLPHDFEDIQAVIDNARIENNGRQILFVFENTRSYPNSGRYWTGKQPKKLDQLTFLGKLLNFLPRGYAVIDEASASHRTDSVKLAPDQVDAERRAAGFAFARVANTVADFERRSIGVNNRLIIVGGQKYDKVAIHLGEFLKDLGTAKNGDTFIISGALALAVMWAEGEGPKPSKIYKRDHELEAIKTAWFEAVKLAEAKGVDLFVTHDADFIVSEIGKAGAVMFNGGTEDVDKGMPALIARDGKITEALSDAADAGKPVLCIGADTDNLMKILGEAGIRVSEEIVVLPAGGTAQVWLSRGVDKAEDINVLRAASSLKGSRMRAVESRDEIGGIGFDGGIEVEAYSAASAVEFGPVGVSVAKAAGLRYKINKIKSTTVYELLNDTK